MLTVQSQALPDVVPSVGALVVIAEEIGGVAAHHRMQAFEVDSLRTARHTAASSCLQGTISSAALQESPAGLYRSRSYFFPHLLLIYFWSRCRLDLRFLSCPAFSWTKA